LPCGYFHAVVTVPSEMRSVFRRNQKLLYGLLMQVSAASVKDLCAKKRHLGALPGMLSCQAAQSRVSREPLRRIAKGFLCLNSGAS
jgi:hypothetical protein